MIHPTEITTSNEKFFTLFQISGEYSGTTVTARCEGLFWAGFVLAICGALGVGNLLADSFG